MDNIKCLMCNNNINFKEKHKETNNNQIHESDYCKCLGFCGLDCWFKIPEKERNKIEVAEMLNNCFNYFDTKKKKYNNII